MAKSQKQNSESLRELIDGLQDLFYVTYPDRRIKIFNRAFISIFKFPSEDFLRGKLISELYVVPKHRILLERCLKSRQGRIVNYFVYVKRFTGEHFCLSVDSNWIDGDEQKGIEGIGRDLTDLVNFLGAFFQIDLDGTLTFCSQLFANLFGYDTPGELIDTNIMRLFFKGEGPGETFTKLIMALRGNNHLTAFKRGDGTELETIFLTSNVSEIRQVINEKLIVVGYQGVFNDVTSSERAQMELNESQSIHELLMAKSQDGIYVIQGKLLKYVSDAFCSIVERGAEELKNMPYLNLIHEEDRAMVDSQVQRKLSGEEGMPYEFRIMTGAGRERVVRVKSGHCRVGGIDSVYGYLRDITPDRRRQEEMTREINERTKSLRDALEYNKILFDTVVHEMDNPTMAIRGIADVLIGGIRGEEMTPYRQLEKIGHIIELCELMSMLQKNIRFVQDDSIKTSSIEKSCHIEKELVSRAQNFIKPLLRDRKFPFDRFTVHLIGSPPFARVNQTHFLQVFFNLFSNAVKYAYDDPNLFKVEIYSDYSPGKGLTLFVSDSGIGISKGDSSIIFEMRKRGANANNIPGMGLGLWVTKTILNAYNCKIWVHQPSKPTVFAIRIPDNLLSRE